MGRATRFEGRGEEREGKREGGRGREREGEREGGGGGEGGRGRGRGSEESAVGIKEVRGTQR